MVDLASMAHLRAHIGTHQNTWNRFDCFFVFLLFLAQLKAPEFQMSTITSALISGVIILGVMSVCFFIFSLTLLKGKSTQLSNLSGVRNPAFN